MRKRIVDCISKIICQHDWQRGERIEEYFDYSGCAVGVYKCKCSKCGKVIKRKYTDWRWY